MTGSFPLWRGGIFGRHAASCFLAVVFHGSLGEGHLAAPDIETLVFRECTVVR